MKNVSKRLLCALSSAILLCGASAIPASAEPHQLPADAFSGNTIDLGTTEYTLNEDYFEITRSEKARIEVRTPMSHFAGRNFISQSYQWYRNGSIINGATSSFYEASEEGRYSCEVTVKSILKSSFEGTSNNTAAKNADICQELIDALREKNQLGTVTVSESNRSFSQVCEYKPSEQESEPTVYNTEEAYVKRVSDLNVRVLSNSGPLDDNGKFELKVSASGGSAPYSYQWKNSSGNVVGTSAATTVTSPDQYYCIVTDSRERVKTSGVVNVRPVTVRIDKQPKDAVICSAKYGAGLSVGVSGGSSPYTYTWYYGSKIVGRDSEITVYDPGNYYCVVKDRYGDTATSRKAYVKINYFNIDKGLPSIYYTYNLNYTEYFKVRVSGGTGTYRYVWQIADKGSDNWVTMDDVTTNAPAYNYDIYLYSTDKKYRCRIYCVDDEGKSGYYRTTNEMEIKKVKRGGTDSCGVNRG